MWSEWCLRCHSGLNNITYYSVEDFKYPQGSKKRESHCCYLSMELLQFFLSDATQMFWEDYWGWLWGKLTARNDVPSITTFSLSNPRAFCSGECFSSWKTGGLGAHKWVTKPSWPPVTFWAVPEVLPGRSRKRLGFLAVVFVLLASWNVSWWQAARKSPSNVPTPSPFSNKLAFLGHTNPVDGRKNSTPWVGRDHLNFSQDEWPGVDTVLWEASRNNRQEFLWTLKFRKRTGRVSYIFI